MLKQLDIVTILSAKRIKFVSGPQGKPAAPGGYWSVVGFIGADILIAKDETIVRAPLSAVSKVASFDTKMITSIKGVTNGQERGQRERKRIQEKRQGKE